MASGGAGMPPRLPAVAAAPAADVPQPVLDDLGNEISLAAGPLRIVSLAPSNTELLFALGLGDHIVGVTRFCNHPQAATAIEQVANSLVASLVIM